MARKILLVEHHDEPRDDLASMFLPKLGFTLEYFRPFAGQSLPDVEEDTAGIIITGGAANVDEMDQYPYLRDEARWIEHCLKKDIPALGLCLGAQLLAHVLGGPVAPHGDGVQEFGLYEIKATDDERRFVPDNFFAAIFTAGVLKSRKMPNGWRLGTSSQIRLFVTETMCLAPSFIRNVHSPY